MKDKKSILNELTTSMDSITKDKLFLEVFTDIRDTLSSINTKLDLIDNRLFGIEIKTHHHI